MKKQFLETGEIVTTHGIKGEVRVYPWCDSPKFITGFKTLYIDNGRQALKVEHSRVQKNIAVVKFEGYENPDEALKLRGKTLYINRDDIALSKDEYFVQDLIGMRVIDAETEREYGVLKEVMQTGANDVYSIENNGAEYLIPAIPEVIIETDIENDVMRIKPLDGIFDNEEVVE